MTEKPTGKRSYRYYDMVMAAFVTVLLCSNLIGPGKISDLWGFSFDVGNIFFPISYIFGDVLTEVYGYARTRKVIWTGFISMIFATIMAYAVVHMPPDLTSEYTKVLQPALEMVFGNTWRVVVGSILAFWAGDFVNSYIMAKMKIWTKGKYLWTRTIGSTLFGQFTDSLIFYPVAFLGLWEIKDIVAVITFNIFFKIAIEALCTPITYKIVHFLKKTENEDYYDYDTNFTPFSLET